VAVLNTIFFAAIGALLTFSDGLAAGAVQPANGPRAVMRLTDSPEMLRLDPKGRFLAYRAGDVIKVLDFKDSSIDFVAKGVQSGASYSWAPDGFRLILARRTAVEGTAIDVFDAAINRSKNVRKIAVATGFPTMDPRTLGAYVLSTEGLATIQLTFPDDRIAKWQVSERQRVSRGRYVATQKGIIWFYKASEKMERLDDDGTQIESFAMSPDGSAIAWATEAGYIYRSIEGSAAEMVDRGRDPAWHPERMELIYAGARLTGEKITGFDLKVSDGKDRRFLTQTPFSDERWPQWRPRGKGVIYTVARTTDIFLLEQER
jgi:hypothetical protein